MKRTKSFDCVEMKRRGALRIHERLASMTFEEQVEYWQGRAEEFRRASSSAGNGRQDRPADAP
jgi:hypothetical protein